MRDDNLAKAIDDAVEVLSPATVTVVTDSNVEKALFPLLKDSCIINTSNRVVITPGEQAKTLESAIKIWEALEECGASRNSLVVNIGGGMITDLGGFAAATFKRGIRYINIPTTLLAMVDAATGGKTGINFAGLKNEIGCFRKPEQVIISVKPLHTLPEEEFMSGYGEMMKTALIADQSLYHELTKIDKLRGNTALLKQLIDKLIEITQLIFSVIVILDSLELRFIGV